MVNLFDLLKGTGNTVKNIGNSLYNRIMQRENEGMTPQITPLQMTENGDIDKAASLALKNQTTPLTFGERMTGRTMTEDFQSIDPKTGEAKLEITIAAKLISLNTTMHTTEFLSLCSILIILIIKD